MLLLKQKWHTTSSNKHKHQCKFRANSCTYFLTNIHSHKIFFYLRKMHPCTIKAPSLPRLFICTSKVYLLPTSHALPWLNLHTCILKAFRGTKNCTCAHLGISNTHTYTNFTMNLDYLHNKVLHFMLFFKFLLPKATCKFKHIFLCWLKLYSN